jgi:hypothetical protein
MCRVNRCPKTRLAISHILHLHDRKITPEQLSPSSSYLTDTMDNYSPPESIPTHQFLIDNMPPRGADTCTVHIWLDIWFWAKHADMTTRHQISQVTWDAARVYSLPEGQLKQDLTSWGFETKLSRELARDIVKARRFVLSRDTSNFGFWSRVQAVFQRLTRF